MEPTAIKTPSPVKLMDIKTQELNPEDYGFFSTFLPELKHYRLYYIDRLPSKQKIRDLFFAISILNDGYFDGKSLTLPAWPSHR